MPLMTRLVARLGLALSLCVTLGLACLTFQAAAQDKKDDKKDVKKDDKKEVKKDDKKKEEPKKDKKEEPKDKKDKEKVKEDKDKRKEPKKVESKDDKDKVNAKDKGKEPKKVDEPPPYSGEIRIYDAKTGKVLQSLIGHTDFIEALAATSDG